MQVISVVFPPSSWFNLHIFCLWFGSFCCSSGDSFWLRLVLSHRRIRNHLSVSSDRLSTYCLTTQNSETQPFVLCHTITCGDGVPIAYSSLWFGHYFLLFQPTTNVVPFPFILRNPLRSLVLLQPTSLIGYHIGSSLSTISCRPVQ